MKQNSKLNPFQQFSFYLGPTIMETAAKTTPQVPKLGYRGGRVTQLSARVTLVPSRPSAVCHISQR